MGHTSSETSDWGGVRGKCGGRLLVWRVVRNGERCRAKLGVERVKGGAGEGNFKGGGGGGGGQVGIWSWRGRG
jgi:hypothetical protein